MISAKKLIKLARKWQIMASIRRKRITLQGTTRDAETNSCRKLSMVNKGHFVVYSMDHKRLMLPLEYLKNKIVMELFNSAEEEFGLPGDGHLILPCDANFMEYVIALIKKKPSKEVKKGLITSVSARCCSSSYLYQQEMSHQFSIYSF
ncbi:putative SAUR-like auxin-responsive protein family [Hibiscus syriacus]|uniref:SAUR-like auxin-responsive protein family n=1 Tax=Hibiscus syriacus TaxID=106335 RepID=A0A6A3C8P0_HIBSY|nr:auxin-responsive protein SAUR68-like [Hibiscus syriacus]KAE8724917.1 putative SAUR-like auxin-responsive protein family [Hibiscus syriacus]